MPIEDGGSRTDRRQQISRIVALENYEKIQELRRNGPFIPQSTTLILAIRLRTLQCSDLRDAIYGFRALARDGDQLLVDYSCSATDVLIQCVSVYNRNRLRRWTPPKSAFASQGDFHPIQRNDLDKALRDEETQDSGNYQMSLDDVSTLIDIMFPPLGGTPFYLYNDLPSDNLLLFLTYSNRPEYPGNKVVNPNHRKWSPKFTGTKLYSVPWSRSRGLPIYPTYLPAIEIHVDGYIYAIRWRKFILVPFGDEFWFSQMWLCYVSQAVHVSRLFYMLCLASGLAHQQRVEFADVYVSQRMEEILQAAKGVAPATTPRHCNCDLNVKESQPAPWAKEAKMSWLHQNLKRWRGA